jgi:hypothetical protein
MVLSRSCKSYIRNYLAEPRNFPSCMILNFSIALCCFGTDFLKHFEIKGPLICVFIKLIISTQNSIIIY